MKRFTLGYAVAAVLLAGTAFSGRASAEMAISADPTAHVGCAAGVCTPTAKKAVLNASDLVAMLAESDVQVVTGAGTQTIAVNAPITWTSTHKLTLQADRNVSVKAVIAVEGGGGLDIEPHQDSGDLLFSPTGRIDFWDTAGTFIFHHTAYALASDPASLPAGASWVAVTKDSDAGADGIYNAFIIDRLDGTFIGLNPTVSNLRLTFGGGFSEGF